MRKRKMSFKRESLMFARQTQFSNSLQSKAAKPSALILDNKNLKLLGMLMLIIVLFALNLVMGSVRIPVGDVVSILMGDDSAKPSWRYIILESRLPQAITAILCGGALAVSGLMLQTAFRISGRSV